ncbi:proline--tRNA ligase [Vermiphilus pyriformis]|nr:MAG: proline--tRNA ligase [Vermiphilus pyriformis]
MNTLPDIKTQFPEWYNQVIYKAELVDESPVRGSYVICPYGWSIWEHIKSYLDERIKITGHKNASFPLFIPESFLNKEAAHVEGFSPELAVVTYAGGKKLEEPLIVRPTSETIIHHMFARWIKSYRDLPLKINQWANVVRWELRPRPFLRTTEFFWQEGHTAHETYEQAQEEAELMMQEYVAMAHTILAIPVITGTKSEQEKFPGAIKTLTFEGVMQDGKALQMGTSHLLSQSFAHAFNMQFQDHTGAQAYPHLTSWGATSRLVGAVIMVHGDQKGLVLPPAIAPIQVVIIPITRKDTDTAKLKEYISTIEQRLTSKSIRTHIDDAEHKSPGAKFYEWELKGVPIRLEIGPRDMQNNSVTFATRIESEKHTTSANAIETFVGEKLQYIQEQMLTIAQEKRQALWHQAEKLNVFGPILAEHNGIYQTGWCQRPECEMKLKEYKATTRCVLSEKTHTQCFACDRPSISDVIVGKAY